MANTGHLWSGWSFVQESGGDWDGDLLADAATDTSDAITSLDQKSACILSFAFVEDNTGAITGDVTIYILGDIDGTNYETSDGNGAPFAVNVTPVQNDTVYYTLPVDPTAYNDFKVAVANNSGQELAVSVRIKTADIPVAS